MGGHDPIIKDQSARMNALAKLLDEMFNGDGPKRIGFALLTYDFDETLTGTGRVNYIGNGERADVLVALKELVARWEGRYSEVDTTQ